MPAKKSNTNKQTVQESKQDKPAANNLYIPARFAAGVLAIIEEALSSYRDEIRPKK